METLNFYKKKQIKKLEIFLLLIDSTAMIPQGGAMLEVRNDGIGRNRSDTSGFFAPLSCESFGGDAQVSFFSFFISKRGVTP